MFYINYTLLIMEIKITKDEKNELEFQIDNQTVAELIRVYLNEDDSVKLGAWKKEHYSKPLILKITTDGKTAKKALQDAIAKARKDLEKYSEEFKKSK
ncbi:DNA-directed RNA polymerase subunit L [uncultured archaeon]|nr:DNA-directed RNA polymerase subunit L [uncultured archaeon]